MRIPALRTTSRSAWWKYVGDWWVNTTTHPTGDLLPIANAVHQAGLKFLLWFEPERMTDSAPILQMHPEYRHGQLVDYGNPEALRWIQDTVFGIIARHGIDVYRQDFNMDPGPVWRDRDAADRVGIAEAKHIAGMYRCLSWGRTPRSTSCPIYHLPHESAPSGRSRRAGSRAA